MPPSIALIVEGEYDIEAISQFVGRLNPGGVKIAPRLCGGPVRGRFQRILKEFRYLEPTLDKAIVVADSHGRDPEVFLEKLRQEITNQILPFPVEIAILVHELEALLLADPSSIEAVCAHRNLPIEVPVCNRSPELLADPKRELERILRQGNLTYTKAIAGEIARNANLDSLDYWCPSYRRLRDAVMT